MVFNVNYSTCWGEQVFLCCDDRKYKMRYVSETCWTLKIPETVFFRSDESVTYYYEVHENGVVKVRERIRHHLDLDDEPDVVNDEWNNGRSIQPDDKDYVSELETLVHRSREIQNDAERLIILMLEEHLTDEDAKVEFEEPVSCFMSSINGYFPQDWCALDVGVRAVSIDSENPDDKILLHIKIVYYDDVEYTYHAHSSEIISLDYVALAEAVRYAVIDE